MAGFRTHITFSSIIGAGYGAAAWGLADVPWPACVLGGGLCAVSGMLPDLDSGSGVPLRESVAFAAAVVPMMLVDRLVHSGMPMEMIVLAGAAVYLAIRFGFAALLKKYTVHRGMFHSIPAALIFGEVGFLLASGDMNIRLFKAGGVVLGFMSHLVLDELWSIQWKGGRIQLKRSFGTAMKFWGRSLWANCSTYGKLVLLTFLVVNDPIWLDALPPGQHEANVATTILRDYFR